MTKGRVLRGLVLVVVWLVVSVAAATVLFLQSSRTIVLASHDATIHPALDGQVEVRTGPLLPDLRLDSGGRIGVDIDLGKTNVANSKELVKRYGYIASQPDGQVAKVQASLKDMALAAALRGAVVGLLPVAFWLLLGRERRRQLARGSLSVRGGVVLVVLALVVVAAWQPWRERATTTEAQLTWMTLPEYLGPQVPVPEGLADVEIRRDMTALGSRRLILSAIETYDKSKLFYDEAAELAGALDVRAPEEGETVVVMVSDRHDNIGMDRVARAIGEAGSATAVFNGGDDTSTGQSWEAFSLDSVSEAFDDLDRWAVTGNHDHGNFVGRYLANRGWTMLRGEIVDGPGGGTLLGVDDPRSSGLGSWRDETGLSFAQVGARLADTACAQEDPVSTVLVHDANLAKEALARGCVDLVLGGHLHVTVPPTAVEGENGRTGYSYTIGTTGGAAYALAIGSKPRRDASIALVTYDAEGRPAGVQTVVLQTNGVFRVGDYRPLELSPLDLDEAEPEDTEPEETGAEEPETPAARAGDLGSGTGSDQRRRGVIDSPRE